jgi:hypothetical protein
MVLSNAGVVVSTQFQVEMTGGSDGELMILLPAGPDEMVRLLLVGGFSRKVQSLPRL